MSESYDPGGSDPAPADPALPDRLPPDGQSITARRAITAPATVDRAARTVEVVWSTGARARNFVPSLGGITEELDMSPNAVRMAQLGSGNAPVLNTHRSSDARDVLGRVIAARLEGGRGHARLQFSGAADVEPLWQRIADGTLRAVSIGYRVHRYDQRPDPVSGEMIYRAVDWEPFEISIVPIPVDRDAQVRGAAPQGAPSFAIEPALADEEPPMTETTPETPAAPLAPPAASPPATPTVETPPDLEALRAEAQRAERERISGIDGAIDAARALIGPETAAHIRREAVERGWHPDQARRSLFDAMVKSAAPPAIPARPETGPGHDSPSELLDAMAEALAARSMPGYQPQGTGRHAEFMGWRPSDMIGELLRVRGERNVPRNPTLLALGDVTERMATPLQPVLFQGTGGQEGGLELKGRPKPVTLGQVFNIAPVFLGNVDLGAGSLPTYQSHWRAIAGHDAIRIRGVAQAIITSGTPLVGQARDYPALGLFQLGASPDGDVTADLRGDTVPIYVNSIAGILRRMLESLGLAYDAADFDTTAWAFAEADLPGIVGFHQGATLTTTLAAAEDILAGSGAMLAAGRGGKLRLADPLATDAPQFDLPSACVLSCEPLPLPASLRPLPRAIAVRWGRNHTPLSNMAGSVAAADRQRLSQEGSFARAESSLITSRVAQQREISFLASYWTEAEALVRAEKWRTVLEAGPRMVRVLTDRFLGQIEIGQIGRVTYPAFGFDEGFVGVVVGWRESLTARRVEITLWGAG